MSKTLFAALLLPLVACSAHKNPSYSASDVKTYEPAPQPESQPATAASQPSDTSALTDDVDVTEPSDVAFLDQMIPHHQEGVKLAKLGQQRAQHQELLDLAANIVAKQEQELTQMQAFRQQWAGDGVAAPEHGMGMQPDHGMGTQPDHGMGTKPDVAGTYGQNPSGTAPADDGATAPQDDRTAQGDTTYGLDLPAEPGATDDRTAQDDTKDPQDDTKDPQEDLTASQDDAGDVNDDVQPAPHEGPAAPGAEKTASDQTVEPGTDVPKDLETLASAEDFDKAFLDAMIRHHERGVEMAKSASPRLEHAEAKALADAIVTRQSEEIAKMKGWRQTWFPSEAITAITSN